MSITVIDIIGPIILILELWAVISVATSEASKGTKRAWVLAIVVLPLVGLIAWMAVGPKGRRGDPPPQA